MSRIMRSLLNRAPAGASEGRPRQWALGSEAPAARDRQQGPRGRLAGDHVASLALFQLALTTALVGDFVVFVTALAFAALVAVLYVVFIPFGARRPGLTRGQVLVPDGAYLGFVGVLVFGVLRSG